MVRLTKEVYDLIKGFESTTLGERLLYQDVMGVLEGGVVTIDATPLKNEELRELSSGNRMAIRAKIYKVDQKLRRAFNRSEISKEVNSLNIKRLELAVKLLN